MKERLSVRGLTTAASIWITAAVGILVGVGFYTAVVFVTILTLGTLSVYRLLEKRIPMLIYFHHSLRFLRESMMPEEDVRALIARHGCAVVNMSYTCANEGKYFDYDMMISTRSRSGMNRLCRTLTERA